MQHEKHHKSSASSSSFNLTQTHLCEKCFFFLFNSIRQAYTTQSIKMMRINEPLTSWQFLSHGFFLSTTFTVKDDETAKKKNVISQFELQINKFD